MGKKWPYWRLKHIPGTVSSCRSSSDFHKFCEGRGWDRIVFGLSNFRQAGGLCKVWSSGQNTLCKMALYIQKNRCLFNRIVLGVCTSHQKHFPQKTNILIIVITPETGGVFVQLNAKIRKEQCGAARLLLYQDSPRRHIIDLKARGFESVSFLKTVNAQSEESGKKKRLEMVFVPYISFQKMVSCTSVTATQYNLLLLK